MLCQETATVSLTYSAQSSEGAGEHKLDAHKCVYVCLCDTYMDKHSDVSTALFGNLYMWKDGWHSLIWPLRQESPSRGARQRRCRSLLPISRSLDVLLIWHVKISFVGSISAFISMSAPSAQWFKSHICLPRNCFVAVVAMTALPVFWTQFG